MTLCKTCIFSKVSKEIQLLLVSHVKLTFHISAALKADMFLEINAIVWPPLVQLIYSSGDLDLSEICGNGRHGRSFFRLCVSLQCVSCSPCHRWWQSSVCDWFWKERRADILSSRCKPWTHSAQCPKAWPGAAWHLTRKVNLYVGAAPCLSTSAVAVPLLLLFFFIRLSLKLSFTWWLNTPFTPCPHPFKPISTPPFFNL